MPVLIGSTTPNVKNRTLTPRAEHSHLPQSASDGTFPPEQSYQDFMRGHSASRGGCIPLQRKMVKRSSAREYSSATRHTGATELKNSWSPWPLLPSTMTF